MSGRVEKLLKAYPEMIQKRDCIAYQLAHFKGLSAEDVIDSMMTPRAVSYTHLRAHETDQ